MCQVRSKIVQFRVGMMVALCEVIGRTTEWHAKVTVLVLCGAVGEAFWGKDLRMSSVSQEGLVYSREMGDGGSEESIGLMCCL